MSRNAKRQSLADTRVLKPYGRARLAVRSACLVGAVVLLWPGLAAASLSVLVPALSPFVALAVLVAARTLPVAALVALVVGAAALVRRRFFCRSVCPVGLCLDGAGKLGRCWGRAPRPGVLWGQWIVLLTLGSACLGWPLLLWLDPLAIFAGVFDLSTRPVAAGAWLAATAFAVVFVLSVVWPNVWCGRICPLGAFQDLLHQAPRRLRAAVGRRDDTHQGADMGGLSRRAVLGVAAGAGSAGMLKLVRGQPRPVLRPPGARDESDFVGLCTRCGNCLRACPSGIIRRDPGQNGWASLLTPVLCFHDDYCREDCTRCTQVCPTGALARLLPADKTQMRLGLPRVDMDVCLLADDRECSACARWCPYDAIRYEFCETTYTLTPQIDAQKCTGCGACEAACPTTPNKAIVVCPA